MVCCCCTSIAFVIALVLIIAKLYIKLTTGWCKSPVCLVGKTAIVTGANTGIGYETALDFAKRGAKVILACRNKDKALEARDKIIRESGNPNVIIRIVDMTSFTSVKNFAKEINETEDKLDILINNAGAGNIPDSKTEDGYQTLIQVNYYSPVLLTLLLIDLLKMTPNSRIVNVSSMGAKWAKFDVNDPDKYTDNNDTTVYCNTKLANILFTIELAKRLRNTSVTTYSLHPGVVLTDFFRNLPAFAKLAFTNLVKYFFKDAQEGAQTQIYCGVQKGIEHLNGRHFEDCAVVSNYRTVKEEDTKVLWDSTMKIIKLTPPQTY